MSIAAGVVDTGGKFAAGINNTSKTGGKICRQCCWYQCKFAAGVVDTGGNFAIGVIETGATGVADTLTCEYLREFSKKFETVLMGYSGAGGKLIHKKLEAKNLVTLSL